MIRECLVCGKEFEACNTCLKGVPENLQWRRVVCCREHFAYHIPIILYVRKVMSKDEAKKNFKRLSTILGMWIFAVILKMLLTKFWLMSDLKNPKLLIEIVRKTKPDL